MLINHSLFIGFIYGRILRKWSSNDFLSDSYKNESKRKESGLRSAQILLNIIKVFVSLIHSQGFTQITWEIRVKTAGYCHVIGQQLQGDHQ